MANNSKQNFNFNHAMVVIALLIFLTFNFSMDNNTPSFKRVVLENLACPCPCGSFVEKTSEDDGGWVQYHGENK